MERRISVRELNQRTSAALHEVAGGAALTITSDGQPVARLCPIIEGSAGLARLVAAGRAVAPTITGAVPVPPEFDHEEVNVAEALAAERQGDDR